MSKSYFKKENIISRYQRKWSRLIKLIALCGLGVILSITLVTPTAAQSWLFPSVSNQTTYKTPWWDLYKARPCGKYWCSRIYLNTGESWLNSFEKLMVASKPDSDKSLDEVAFNVEERARVVQRTLSQIIEDTINSSKMSEVQPQRAWQYLIETTNKPLHPATPKLEIGIENKQTVVYVPEQPDLELTQQAIITVNRIDARANGKSVEELAKVWRDLTRRHLSEKLWGYELDKNHPWFRIVAAAGILLVVLMAILTVGFFVQIIKQLERKIHSGLMRLIKSLAVNPESASAEELAELEELQAPIIGEENVGKDSVENDLENRAFNSLELKINTPESLAFSQTKSTKNNTENQLNRVSIFNFWYKARGIRNILSTQMKTLGRIKPQTAALLQLPLKQIENLIQLSIRLLFWGQILIFLMGITLILLLFPASRLYFRLFLVQTILLPLTWMLISILDKISDIIIDYSLNQWGKEAQRNNPSSNRYALRISTYSPVLKKVSTFIFVCIGIYITVLLFGIDPGVLAGASIFAVALAFLSRNLLENMLNGILILAEDRYALGDVIEVNGMGGCVENINLFSTGLRNLDGQLIIIPNSLIGIVINMTKDWSRVNFSIKIAYDADVNKAKAILQEVTEAMQKESEWQQTILETPIFLGVDEVSHEGILLRMLIKTAPSQQWAVAREFRLRVQREFLKSGILPGIPQSAIWRINHGSSPFEDN